MKHMIINIRRAFFSMMLLALATSISLANTPTPVRDGGNNEAQVRYIPGKSGEIRFNVLYSNPDGSRCSVSILDGDGNQLYQKFFTDRNFDKTFKLADPDLAGKLTFVIRNFGDNSVQRFEAVNHLVENIDVKEIK